MKVICKALFLPAVVAVVSAGLYLWRMLHVWPPGKEGWLEEGVVMMAFHIICLVILLPVSIWSISLVWHTATLSQRFVVAAAAVGLLVATVALPEIALKRMQRIRPNHPVERTASQPTGSLGDGGVSGGWLAVAHFYRSAKNNMKTIIAVLLVTASTFSAFAGETNGQPALRIGEYVKLPGAQGFLQYSEEHSGVRVCALSADIGSAVPSGDLRLYARYENNYRLVLSLPMLTHKGYRCTPQGDTLRVHVVSKYDEKPNANTTPAVVINLSQLVNAYAEPGASPNAASPRR